MSDKVLSFVYGTDGNDVAGLRVSIASLRAAAWRYAPLERVVVRIISNERHSSLVRLCGEMATPLFVVELHVPSAEKLARLSRLSYPRKGDDGKGPTYCTYAMYFRFLVCDIVREDKCVYLDTDTLVTGDVFSFPEPGEGNVLSAVRDANPILWGRVVPGNTYHGERYFNSGVVCFDINAARNDLSFDRLVDIASRTGKYDQSVLNIAVAGKVRFVDPRWNVMANAIDRHVKRAGGKWVDLLNSIYHTGYGSLDDLLRAAVVIHYTGQEKPWLPKGVELDERFREKWDLVSTMFSPERRFLSRSAPTADDLVNMRNAFVITMDESRLSLLRRTFAASGLGQPAAVSGVPGGVDGIRAAHRNVVAMARAMGLPYVIDLEDDAYPCIDVARKAMSLDFSGNGDMFVIGYANTGPLEGTEVGGFSRVKDGYMCGTHAMLIRNTAYDRLDSLWSGHGHHADMVVKSLCRKDAGFCLMAPKKPLFIQYTAKRSNHLPTHYHYFPTVDNSHDAPPDGFYEVEALLGTKPSVTLLTVCRTSEAEKARKFLEHQASMVQFLRPRIKVVAGCESMLQLQTVYAERLVDEIATTHALIIESDASILDPSKWTDEFFKYDYIGACWMRPGGNYNSYFTPRVKRMGLDPDDEDSYVGNSGFCLVSRKMLQVSKEMLPEYVRQTGHAIGEVDGVDVHMAMFCRKEAERRGLRIAPCRVCRDFSVECDRYTGSFGVHNMVITVDGRKLECKKNRFPDARLLSSFGFPPGTSHVRTEARRETAVTSARNLRSGRASGRVDLPILPVLPSDYIKFSPA